MAAILLSQVEQGADGLLVVRVLLTFNNHLLEAPDDLVATLLGNLALEVLLGALAVFLLLSARSLLGVIISVGVDALLQSVKSSLGAAPSIDARRSTSLLVTSSRLGNVSWVAGSIRVGLGRGLVGGVLDILLRVTSVDSLSLVLQVVLGEVGGIMPSVVLRRAVNLVELLLVRSNLLSGVGSGIASHVAEEDTSILD
jgi:hypothetical protein